jgi:predicted Zn-dependent protease
MLPAFDDFEAIKRRVEEIGRRRDEIKGELKQVKKRLRDDYNCESVADARTMLDKLGKKERTLSGQYGDALTKFKEEFADILNRR